MPRPSLHTCERILLVEGYSDLLFFAELFEHLGFGPNEVFIKDFGGKNNMTTAALETFLSPARLAEAKPIGLIVDADASLAGTRTSFEERLTKITGQPVQHGAWTKGSPRIGLFVASGTNGKGEIESLVWEAWSNDPSNATAKTCVEGFLDCMRGAGLEAQSPDKGRIGALLSVRSDDDPRLGPGARARVFDFARPELAGLVSFLRAFR